MTELRWTLATLVALGGTAMADTPGGGTVDMASEAVSVTGSHRGVAQDYLVMPRGGELSSTMRFLTTSDPMLGDGEKLKFTDLALFGLSARYSLFSRLELGASVELLPKQPSSTDEKPWQSVGVHVKSPLGRYVAVTLAGGGGHLLNHSGMWTRESLMIEWKKPIHELLAFDIQGGVSGLGLSAEKTTSSTAFLTEAVMSTTALFHDPKGKLGAWVGITYAVPVQKSGRDPTTELAIDPQPRMNFHMGAVLSLVSKWDLFADFAVIDRGDIGSPATRMPILDGGFDQKQIIFGVTRHIEPGKRDDSDDYDDDDGMMRVGSL